MDKIYRREHLLVSRAAGALGLVGSVLCLWVGCGPGEPPRLPLDKPHRLPSDKPGAAGDPCDRDADCSTGFCENNLCAKLAPDRDYGGACVHIYPTYPPGFTPPVENGCNQGRICREGRCRSCVSDAECQSIFGMGKCQHTQSRQKGEEDLICVPHRIGGERGVLFVNPKEK